MVWAEKNSRRVEEAMRAIEAKATVPAWLYAYDLLVANPVPEVIPLQFKRWEDRILLEALRRELTAA